MALVPWAGAKLILLGALAAGLSAQLARGFTAPRASAQRACLVGAWAALVASPYWLIPPSAPLRLLGLLGSAAIVFAWSRLAGSVAVRPAPKAGGWAPWLVSAVLLAWHGPGLFAPLEFRGDEDLHVARPLRALEGLAHTGEDRGPLIGVALAAALLALAASARARRVAITASLALVPAGLAALFLARPPEPELLIKLARYPVLGAWLSTIAAFSPLQALGAFRSAIHDEALYRLVPFASGLGIALLALRATKGPRWLRAGGAILIATAPTVTYFSSSAYPDITAAALATAGLMGVDVAARRALAGRPERAGASGLLALSLLAKEALAPTAVVAAALGFVRRGGPRGRTRSRLQRATAFGLVLLLPLSLYVGWRVLAQQLLLGGAPMRGDGQAWRGVVFDASALQNPRLVEILLGALLQQFGPLFPLAAAALVLARRRFLTWMLPIAAGAQLALFVTEYVATTEWGRLPLYLGFARYQLTLLPSIVCLAILGLRALAQRSLLGAALIVSAGLSWNLLARPVALDGSRTPFWGDYVGETSGERYPYDALYEWLARADERRPLTILGRDYSYRDDFYLMKYGLDLGVSAPRAEMPRSSLVLASALDRAALLRAHVALLERAGDAPGPVVLHVSAWLDADELPRDVGGLQAVRSFRLGRHALILYAR